MQARFTVVRPLGEGGQGRVLAVTDGARDGATVALKETPRREAMALRREFALLARLRHPNLVAVYDWLEVSPLADDPRAPDAPAAYTQELVAGVDLWRAARGAPDAEREALFEQILRALAYLHGLGVAHLDLKPDNVIVSPSTDGGLARLLDFGIAASFDGSPADSREDASPSVKGSFSYIAPERLAGGGFDQRADLYALGVMMAEVAVGRAPSPTTLRDELAEPTRRRAWLEAAGVPTRWLELVTALLAPHPADRPATAWEAAALWARARGRPLALHTATTAAAVVRAGPPVGREAELDAGRRALARGSVILVGDEGAGRAAVARALGREAQLAGRSVEWWPHSATSRTAAALGAALARLTGEPALAELLDVGGRPADRARGERDAAAEVPGRDDDAARYDAWVAERAERVVAALGAIPDANGRLPCLIVRDLDAAPALARRVVLAIVAAEEAGERLPISVIAARSRHDGPAALPIGPLDRAGVEAFLVSRFGVGVASAQACAVLATASAGRPGQLETLTTLLVDRGSLAPGPEGWSWRRDVTALALPQGVEEALALRLEALPPRLRRPLAALAWLRFPAPAERVAAALDVGAAPMAELLELEAAGLVWRDPKGRFSLAHPSQASALTGWEPPGGEAAAHDRARGAATGEAGRMGRGDPLAAAWHLRGDPGAREALAIGAAAWAERRPEAAAEALDLALELAEGDEVRRDALALRAEVADLLGPREVQVGCLERLVASLDAADPAALRARSRLFWALTRVGDAARAEEVGRDVIARAERDGARGLLAEVLVHLAVILTQRGAYDEAEDLLARAGASAAPEALGLRARVANNLGNVYSYRERHGDALGHYTEAHRLKVAEGDPVGQRIAVGNMGLMCLRLGRPAEAYAHFGASLAAARATGHRRGEAWSLCALGELGVEAGAHAYAERRLEAALALADELGDRVIACDAETTLAESLLARGEVAAATARAASALDRARASQSGYTGARARLVLASARAGGCGTREGEEPQEAAETIAREALADDVTRARAERLAAELALARGDLDRAARAARRASAAKGRARSPMALVTAARVAAACGDPAGAAQRLAEARELALTIAAGWPDEAVDDGVGDGAAIDGPSRRTWLARGDVAPVVVRCGDGGEAGADRVVEAAGEGAMRETASGLERAAVDAIGGGALRGIEDAIGAWLAATVRACGAERGFLVTGTAGVLAARDLDGEAIADADRKLPEVAVEQTRAAGGVWRAAGGEGRGAIAGLGVRGGSGAAAFDCVLVLQNRFVSEAFGDVAERAWRLEPLRALLACWALLVAVDRLTVERALAEAQAREVESRSTEELLTLRRELESTREQLGPRHEYGRIVFASSQMKRMLRQVDRVIDTDLPVYIHGESGTGKELIARAIHDLGPRARGPFIAQNVSAIPHTLFESELFGHERGAFTGANRTTDGLFKRASGGTLFLDEIGDLPLDQQAKLLRVLETGEVRAVGSARSVRVDVRVLSATHHDLKELVREERFREDLFYRLNVIRITVPPLRERPDDIPVLAEHFLAARRGERGGSLRFGDGVMKALVGYAWPGNVRQLENEVTRAALLADGDTITARDLSPEITEGGAQDRVEAALGARLGLDRGPLKDRVDRLERAVLSEAMGRLEGNKSQIARELGLSRAGLNMKLKRLGLAEG